MPLSCRSGERRGRADTWSDAQENFLHSDANSASKKENHDRDEKEIADANTVPNWIAFGFAKKKEESVSGGRIAVDYAKKGESFTDSVAEFIHPPEEEAIADSGAV